MGPLRDPTNCLRRLPSGWLRGGVARWSLNMHRLRTLPCMEPLSLDVLRLQRGLWWAQATADMTMPRPRRAKRRNERVRTLAAGLLLRRQYSDWGWHGEKKDKALRRGHRSGCEGEGAPRTKNSCFTWDWGFPRK